jgi:hypothetical protein
MLIKVKKKIIIFSALISTVLFIGSAFPYGFPLFTPSVFIFLSLCIVSSQHIYVDKLNFYFLLLIAIYILSLGIFGELYSENIKDIANGIVVLIFFVLFQSVIRSRIQFNQYTKYIQNYIFLSSFIIASIGLVKFYFLLQGNEISLFHSGNRKYPLGTTLVNDYNTFGLTLISGLVSGYYIMKRKLSLHFYVAVNLMALTIFIAAVFAASRRTWFVLSVYSLVLVGAFIKNRLKNIIFLLKNFKLKRTELLKKLTLGITLTAIIMGFVTLVPTDISLKHTHQLARIQKRLVSIKNMAEINLQPDPRYKRYNYAFQLINEYSVLNLLIGNGSNYLQRFGQKFGGSDIGYPHNLILTAILQSGLIGAVFVIGYIFYCFFLYLKHFRIKETRFYFFLMFISSFYWLVSGNSIFSSKIYIFFALLMPFAINRIFKSAH